jgi:hypothetical protein
MDEARNMPHQRVIYEAGRLCVVEMQAYTSQHSSSSAAADAADFSNATPIA